MEYTMNKIQEEINKCMENQSIKEMDLDNFREIFSQVNDIKLHGEIS